MNTWWPKDTHKTLQRTGDFGKRQKFKCQREDLQGHRLKLAKLLWFHSHHSVPDSTQSHNQQDRWNQRAPSCMQMETHKLRYPWQNSLCSEAFLFFPIIKLCGGFYKRKAQMLTTMDSRKACLTGWIEDCWDFSLSRNGPDITDSTASAINADPNTTAREDIAGNWKPLIRFLGRAMEV